MVEFRELGTVGAAGFNFTKLYELAEGYGTTNTPLQDSLFHAEMSSLTVVFNTTSRLEAIKLLDEIVIAREVYPAIAECLTINWSSTRD